MGQAEPLVGTRSSPVSDSQHAIDHSDIKDKFTGAGVSGEGGEEYQ